VLFVVVAIWVVCCPCCLLLSLLPLLLLHHKITLFSYARFAAAANGVIHKFMAVD
jgi:hypothetical protein